MVETATGNNDMVETATGNNGKVFQPSFDIKRMEADGPITRKLHVTEKQQWGTGVSANDRILRPPLNTIN